MVREVGRTRGKGSWGLREDILPSLMGRHAQKLIEAGVIDVLACELPGRRLEGRVRRDTRRMSLKTPPDS